GGIAGPAARLVPDRALLLDPGYRARGDPRSRALGLPGDQGADRLRRVRDDGVEPARRPHVQGGGPAGAAQVKEAAMASEMTLKAPARTARGVPHTVSPGLWALAWKRLKSDNVGMVSLAIVVVFILMMIASGTGLIARDWSKEGRGN